MKTQNIDEEKQIEQEDLEQKPNVEGGFIAVHRSLLEWQYHDSMTALGLWIHILLKANWKDGYFSGKPILRGQLATSMQHLADETSLHPNTVRKWLKKFEEAGQISLKSTNKYTVITVINYAKYQGHEFEDVKQSVKQDVKQDVKQSVKQDVKQSVHNRIKKQYNKEISINNNVQNEPPEEVQNGANDDQNGSYVVQNDAVTEVFESTDIWFNQFWNMYPKRKAKKKAKDIFTKKCKTAADFDQIMNGLKNYIANDWADIDPQFIPLPTTWLNGERWNDEMTPRKKTIDDMLREEIGKDEQERDPADSENNIFGTWWNRAGRA